MLGLTVSPSTDVLHSLMLPLATSGGTRIPWFTVIVAAVLVGFIVWYFFFRKTG